MRYLFMAALVGSSALAAPAMAQDSGAFDGPSVTVIGGYDGLRPGSSEDIDGVDQSTDGFAYGVQAGYDMQIDRAVIGVEGEVADSTADTDAYDGSAPFGYGDVQAGRDLYIGARAGYLVSPSSMVYVKGGYSNARLDLTTANGDRIGDRHFNLDGYRIGAGYEQKIGTNLIGKIEYRYSNYNDARLEYTNGNNTDNFDVDTDRHQVMVGVGYQF